MGGFEEKGALIFAGERRPYELSRHARSGRIRRIARGLYTTDLTTDLSQLVRSHWQDITAEHFPGAVITDRSAPLVRPDSDGYVFVVHSRKRRMVIPGLTVVPRPGPGPRKGDIPLPSGLWLASAARALVENAVRSRMGQGGVRRRLTERELHDWVLRLRQVDGVDRLNATRDEAKVIAAEFGLGEEFERLDDIIGAALGTRSVNTESPGMQASIRGLAYDERRSRGFEILAKHLASLAPRPRVASPADAARRSFLPFFEAYFSNFIEGTEFTVEEARQIAFEPSVTAARPADAHDVRGTFDVVSDDREMSRVPGSYAEFVELLRARHARVLQGRPQMRPGEVKVKGNRAGTTDFVAPELVAGTLARGLELQGSLTDPFSRAVFMVFLVSEVHPFDDGNGRVARVMMNAELHSAGATRIIIPTVFRNEYVSGLRALTLNQLPQPLVSVLDFAQRYTQQIDFSSIELAKAQLSATNAFMDSNEAERTGTRLMLPSRVPR